MNKAEKLFGAYVEAAENLAEAVKRDISHENKIGTETISKLNKFVIASNEICDLIALLGIESKETNKKLN